MRVVVFFISFLVIPWWSFGLQSDQIEKGLEYHVTGTGNTTGHIVDINIYNATAKRVDLEIGPYLIPSADTTQGYVVPDSYDVTIPAGGEVKLELTGYCTNPFLPPVKLGGNLKPFSKWAPPDKSPDVKPEVNLGLMEGFAPFSPLRSDSILFCFPGTNEPLLYVIDIDNYPLISARMVIELANKVISAYDRMKNKKMIQTPFSDNVSKEAWSIRQQAIWYAISLLKGSNYGKEALRSSLIGQYEDLVGIKYEEIDDEIKSQLEIGIKEVLSAVLEVGFEARVNVPKN
jgi:hypothetical protein